MNKEMTTDTPRTDDQFPWKAECPRMSNYCDKHLRGYWRNVGSPWHGVIKEAFEIEKELNASKAEVAELNSLMVGWKQRATMSETSLEAEKAEVERLNNILENTRESRDTIIEDRNLLDQELAASKAEVARLQMELDATCNAEELRQEREARKRAEAEVERLGGLLYETRSLLTKFFDCVDIGGLHDGGCNISTEDPEKWDLGCNCTTAELRKKYIRLYSK